MKRTIRRALERQRQRLAFLLSQLSLLRNLATKPMPGGVQQTGPAVPGHFVKFAGSSLIQDGGASGTLLYVEPPQGTDEGVKIKQVGPNAQTEKYNNYAGNEFAYNSIVVFNDNVLVKPGNVYTSALDINLFTGANDGGSKSAIKGVIQKGQNSNPPLGRDHVAVIGECAMTSSDGGVDAGAGSKGTAFGVAGLSFLFAGSTNYLQCVGVEADAGIFAGASSKSRFGMSAVGGGQLQASSVYDAAYEIAATGGPWKFGMLFSALHGAPIVTGTLIGTDGYPHTVVNGIDFSAYTMTGSLLKGANFSIGGGALVNAANDAAAAAAGVIVGQMYRNGSTLMVRAA